ncbi:MAG: glycine--tRNA ligase subunit beta [Magnetococcales bacterium]|nr:glycine--tRNA ligase subunit beta [Magnetococcales bacterium]
MSEFLLEIGCEEIPARMLPGAIGYVKERLETGLREAGLTFDRVETHGTPRRLMAGVTGLAAAQPDRVEERRGPSLDKGFDADGNPTKAVLGFARSCGIDVGDLVRVETPKGIWLMGRIRQPGRPTADILPEILAALIREIPWPKTMRWGDGETRFVRPLHRVTALLDGQVVPLHLEHLTAGDEIDGHRFMAPGPHRVTGIAQYRETLLKARVMLEVAERERVIRAGAEALAAAAGGRAVIDDGLLSENACLNEWPVPLLGRFEERFLEIPPEVLTTSMKSHQKYFPVVDGQGAMLPCFILVANMVVPDPDVIVRGNQRVLRARLEDAAFYWREDRQMPLGARLDGLKNVVFQARLGSLWQKSMRLSRLAGNLAAAVNPELVVTLATAGCLSKCDLVTGMVGQFPELQGIMGGYYAQAAGLDAEVAGTIAGHYRPQGAADSLPDGRAAALLAIVDRLDTLTGCFGIGLVPTGAKDPFALRRAALGVIRMVTEGEGIALPLRRWIATAHAGYDQHGERLDQDVTAVVESLLGFFYGRLKSHLKAEGLDYDLIDAVQALGLDDLHDAMRRVRALAHFKGLPEYEALVAANKRIANILQQAYQGVVPAREVETGPAVLRESAEQALFAAIPPLERQVAEHCAAGAYSAALETLAGLRENIDRFFEQVLVMDSDHAVRDNRLALLARVRNVFARVADVSCLVLPENR